MSLVTTAGYTWTSGETVTATKLNLAAVPTIADGQPGVFSDVTASGTVSGAIGSFTAYSGQESIATTFAGRKYVTAQFDTTTTVLANATGLSVNVASSGVYGFELFGFAQDTAGGGYAFGLGGTATATSVRYGILGVRSDGTVSIGGGLAISLGTALAITSSGGGSQVIQAILHGLITVNAGGTLTGQFAQQALSGTSSLLVGSYFNVWRVA